MLEKRITLESGSSKSNELVGQDVNFNYVLAPEYDFEGAFNLVFSDRDNKNTPLSYENFNIPPGSASKQVEYVQRVFSGIHHLAWNDGFRPELYLGHGYIPQPSIQFHVSPVSSTVVREGGSITFKPPKGKASVYLIEKKDHMLERVGREKGVLPLLNTIYEYSSRQNTHLIGVNPLYNIVESHLGRDDLTETSGIIYKIIGKDFGADFSSSDLDSLEGEDWTKLAREQGRNRARQFILGVVGNNCQNLIECSSSSENRGLAILALHYEELGRMPDLSNRDNLRTAITRMSEGYFRVPKNKAQEIVSEGDDIRYGSEKMNAHSVCEVLNLFDNAFEDA